MFELLLKMTSELLIAYPILSSKRPKFKFAKRQKPKQGERQHARPQARAPVLLKGRLQSSVPQLLAPRFTRTAGYFEAATSRGFGARPTGAPPARGAATSASPVPRPAPPPSPGDAGLSLGGGRGSHVAGKAAGDERTRLACVCLREV